MTNTEVLARVEIDGVLGQDEGRDPLRTPRWVGNGGDNKDLANSGVRDETLGSVEQVVAVLLFGRGARAAGVATGTFFGQSETAEYFATRKQWHVAFDLFPCSEFHDRRRAQRGVGADGD